MPVFSEDDLKAELLQIMAQGVSRSQASRQLAQITKLSRRQLYQLALSIPGSDIEVAKEDFKET
jgi:16S rRNA (cytidine1402-2'-O)-methyltransferase